MGRILLVVGERREFLLDPQTGSVVGGDAAMGHPQWFVAAPGGVGPRGPLQDLDEPGLQIALSLSLDEQGVWSGTGHASLTGPFSHFSEIMQGGDLAGGYLGRLAGSVVTGIALEKAVPTAFNLAIVQADLTVGGLTLEPDAFDRKVLTVGRPAGGLLDNLPHDVQLGDLFRTSPVLGVGGWQQSVILRLEVTPDEVRFAPEPAEWRTPPVLSGSRWIGRTTAWSCSASWC